MADDEKSSERRPLRDDQANGILNSLLADLPGVVYRCRNDRDWTMLGLTANVEELTGYRPSELIESEHIPFVALIHPEDRQRIWRDVQEAVEKEVPYRLAYRIVTRSGEERWVLEQGRAVREGDEAMLTGYIQDVTTPLSGRLSQSEEKLGETQRQAEHLRLLQSVTAIVNEERRLEDALRAAIPALCRSLGFSVGHAFLADLEGEGLRASDIWHLDPAVEGLEEFRAATESEGWDVGSGLPGRVLKSGAAEWVEDVKTDPDFYRVDEASSCPVASGVGVPIRSCDETLACLELYTTESRSPDAGIARLLEQIGVQLGRVWEREEADRERRSGEERFRQLAENVDAMFWLSTPEGEPLYVSSGLERLTGTEERIEDWREFLEIIHPEDRDRMEALYSDPRRAPYEVEYRIVRANGETRWIRQKAFPFLDDEQNVELIGGMADDVTESRRGRERLERILDSLAEGVVIIDREGRITYANEAGFHLMPGARSDLVGRSYDFPDWNITDLDGSPIAPEELPAARSLRTGEPIWNELMVVRGSGDFAPLILSVNAVPYSPEGGEVVEVIVSFADVTERERIALELREREKRFRALIESSTDVIGILDDNLVTRYVSPSVTEMLGYDPEEITRTRGQSRVHPDDAAKALEELRELRERPGASLLQSHRMIAKDGSVRHVESAAHNLLHEPAVAGIVVNLRDITERKALESQLRQAQRVEAVGRLAGGIAHDFNNLLTVIRSQADLSLMDLAPAEPLAEELEVIREAADRAARLTGQLLAFSREQVLRPRVVDLNEVVAALQQLLARILGEHITVETELDQDLPTVRVDPSQIEQVIVNLAVNARDAMPEGGVLRVSTGVEDLRPEETASMPELEPGPKVRLTVSDTGVGMEEEIRSRVFEPFFTTKEAQEGTGLGLAVSYGIVRQSGGTIQVDSRPGRGTTFTVRFPPAEGAAEAEDLAGSSGLERRVGAGSVLVIEDEPSVRRVAEHILERSGFEVHSAADAESGLRMLDAGDVDYDLVLTDLVLPGLRGRELVDRLLERSPRIPVVVMSGYARGTPDSAETLPPEVPFIQKPFSPAELAEVVRRQLRS